MVYGDDSMYTNPFDDQSGEADESAEGSSLVTQDQENQLSMDQEDAEEDMTVLMHKNDESSVSDISPSQDAALAPGESNGDENTFLDDSFSDDEEDDLPNTGILDFIGSESLGSPNQVTGDESAYAESGPVGRDR